MKKLIISTVAIVLSISTFAQSDKYTNKMTELLAQFDSSRSTEAFNNVAAAFERVADAEKTQWLPYYYASLCKINSAMFQIQGEMGDNSAITDPAADKAENLLNKALTLAKENSETWVIKKMIASLRMMGNPMQRYMQYGQQAQEALETAKALDANNPRVYLLEAQDKYYTPEQFGGSKVEAKQLFTKVVELSKTFKPETALHPNWGLSTANYFLSTIK